MSPDTQYQKREPSTSNRRRVRDTSNNNNDKTIYYKDVALIRYKDESVQVVNDTGFMNTFLKRANDEYWKQVSCIQTNVKSKIGCGTPIIIKFYAPIDYEEPDNEITYDYKALGGDKELIMTDEH